MRTIEAPGVEINEIDKSQYSPALAGTTALIAGFANKGEDYTAMQMTSRSAWINYYGEPDNEAERYFYTACMEAINLNGKLYCAKIPYENEARDKYAVKKYTVSTKCKDINSVNNYISSDPNLVKLLDGDYTRYGYGLSDIPGLKDIDDEAGKTVLKNYALMMLNYDKNVELILKYNRWRNNRIVAVPLFFKYTTTSADDNWWYYRQTTVHERLSSLFNPNSHFWSNVGSVKDQDGKVLITRKDFEDKFTLSSLDNYIEDYLGGGTSKSYDGLGTSYYSPAEYVSAFVASYADVFGPQANEYEPYNFNIAKLNDPDTATNNFKDFIKDNRELFKTISRIIAKDDVGVSSLATATYMTEQQYDDSFTKTNKFKANDFVPYIYVPSEDDIAGQNSVKRSYCNLMAYYTAAKNIIDTNDLNPVEDVAPILSVMSALVAVRTSASDISSTNPYICSRNVVAYRLKDDKQLYRANSYTTDSSSTSAAVLASIGVNKDDVVYYECNWFDTEVLSCAPYINLSSNFIGSLSKPLSVDISKATDLGISQEELTELITDLINFKSNERYQKIIEQLVVGKKVNTPYVKLLFDFYATNINISSYYDKAALYAADATIDTLKHTISVNLSAGLDEKGNEITGYTDQTFFEVYGNLDVIDTSKSTFEKELEVLERVFNKTVTKPLLIDMVNNTRKLDAFIEIEPYLQKTPTTRTLYTKFNQEKIEESLKYSELNTADPTIEQYLKITSNNNAFTASIVDIDEYKTDESRVPPNQIYIADMTRSPYVRTTDIYERECIGIVPVITTAANALIAQSIIENVTSGNSYASYQPLSSIATLRYPASGRKKDLTDPKCSTHDEFIINGNINAVATSVGGTEYAYNLSTYCSKDIFSDDPDIETVSQEAAGYFSTIRYNDEGKLDRENMYDIGVIVFKAYLDASEGNKVSFNAVESYIGSLDRNAVNPNTGVTKFIDTIVNENSEYINLFSNCFASTATRLEYDTKCDILVVEPQKAASLGFYEDMVVEDISIAKSIYDGLEKIFDKNKDINEKEIDIVCDAGMSNIAQYIKSVYGTGKGPYDPASTEAAMFKLKSRNDTLTWRNVILKFDLFCKNERKDCMFIADGLRPFCLQGQKKIVRPTKPTNSIDVNLLPNIKYMTGLNTNYGAGYCDWFQKADDFTGEYFWCPPSIQAMGIYIYTDVHAEYWDAPAGLNRGIVAALDVAFSPTMKQAGTIYNNNWNYAINYPQDGIVLEGQKTFLVKPSAFDRVNVRRLFLRLERQAYKVARYFVYEGNTAYTRQRLIDALDPIFADVKLRNGIYDYKIICDESINTPEVIDRNELKVKIGIKPVKTAEFILIDFIALTTGGSFSEM